jgi:hypothetical protein
MNRDKARNSEIGDMRISSELSYYGCQQRQAVSPLDLLKEGDIFKN